VKSVWVSDRKIDFANDIARVTVFEDFDRLRPVHLALHKRLLSNPADGLSGFDLACDSARIRHYDFSGIDRPSHFAKSGTTDPVLRPYDADLTSAKRTNYGLWNAVLRLHLSREDVPDSLWGVPVSPPKSMAPETLDVTVACVGECHKNTGAPEGKVLHKFLTNGLLRNFGLVCQGPGYYRVYEQSLLESTPDSILLANPYEPEGMNRSEIRRIQNKTRTLERGAAGLEQVRFKKRFLFGFGLDRKAELRLLRLAPYMGAASQNYLSILEDLGRAGNPSQARAQIKKLAGFQPPNRYSREELDIILEALERSLSEMK